MNEFLYDQPSVLIAAGLLLLIHVANYAGLRAGLWSRSRWPGMGSSQASTIEAATLGLLALLLGFSFSMALDRYDTRVQAVVDEANAFGAARLRTTLLPDPQRTQAQALMGRYLDVRLTASRLSLDKVEERRDFAARIANVQEGLWAVGSDATRTHASPVHTALFVESLNALFDAQTRRSAALDAHVPEFVLLVLFAVFAIAGGITGYASGLDAGQSRMASLLMSLLIVLVMFVIIDLDRPRRGLIQVPQATMESLAVEPAPAEHR